MSTPSTKHGGVVSLIAAVALVLACSVTSTTPEPPALPAYDPTKAMLEFQATAAALELTQVALNSQPQEEPAVAPAPVQPQPAAPQAPTATFTPQPPPPTEDMEAKIRAAKVLVYENTDERGIGMWVQDALDGMGMQYTQTGSYSGHFMEYLNSGIPWDLLIVDAEDKDIISGEFWDVIYNRLSRDKVALIAEVWYLDTEANGPIGKVLSGCGVQFRKDMPLDSSIYWWVPQHPVFNEPNTVLPLIHYDLFWANQAGDKLLQGGSGDATMLAGLSARPSSGEGVLATCYDGRVIIATYSDHDYHQGDIVPLWQNFIYNTLKNHFLALE